MKLQKARTDKICDECLGKILKGEKYWNNWNEEARASVSKTHTNCELFRDSDHEPDNGWPD